MPRHIPVRRPLKAPDIQPKTKRVVPRPLTPWQAAESMLGDVPPEDMVIFDVGAHFGNVTAHMMRIWRQAKVYCFDPDPASLIKLHARFDDDERVDIIPSALGSTEGTTTFHICGQRTEMSSVLPRSSSGRRYYRHLVKEKIRVPVTTVDHFVAEHDLKRVHLMKIDVQGGERYVFRGAQAALRDGLIDVIYSEVLFVDIYRNAYHFWQLCRELAKYGYQVFDIYNLQRSWINRQLKYGDAMWVSPTVRSQVLDEYPEEWLGKSLPHRMRPDL